MIRTLKKINNRIDKMDQGNFNLVLGIIFTITVIIPMAVIGFNRWADLYLK